MKYLSLLPLLLSLCVSLSSCEAEIDVTPDEEKSRVPKFNFLVRQLDSEKLLNDTTLVIDTVEVTGSDPRIDTTVVVSQIVMLDTIKAELYIKQLDYKAENEKYKLIVTLPANFDGLMHYKGAIYRSGDWIEIQYKDLVDYATVVNITQRQQTAGQYSLNLVCVDSKDNSKSATLAIKVP